jgi:integrase
LKTAWKNAKARAGVTGRLHDFRHTAITELAENGAGDQVIKGIVGHVSDHMIKHYSHVRTEAKREALEGLASKNKK